MSAIKGDSDTIHLINCGLVVSHIHLGPDQQERRLRAVMLDLGNPLVVSARGSESHHAADLLADVLK